MKPRSLLPSLTDGDSKSQAIEVESPVKIPETPDSAKKTQVKQSLGVNEVKCPECGGVVFRTLNMFSWLGGGSYYEACDDCNYYDTW